MTALSVLLEGGSIIDLDGTVLVQLAIFWILFTILYFLVFKPMMRLFEARETAIDGARVEARDLEKKAKASGSEFDDELRKLKLAAGEERDRLRTEGGHLERALLERVRKETQQTLESAHQKLDLEAAKVRADSKTTIPQLARDIATQLLGREVR